MIHAASTAKETNQAQSISDAVKSLLRERGIGGLWSGLGPVLCKQATNSAVRFTTFATLQEKVVAHWPKLEGNIGSTLVLGGISGIFTVYASMPFDTTKTKMQGTSTPYGGMFNCMKQMLINDGVISFWRGTSPRLVRLILSSGITFTVYDQMIRLMRPSAPPRTSIL
ncbi:mitochondrial carrier protein [Truncatella angustata]|uniref:Mitochondrial carrier protein n=1 Tax=Truncatella angustata TaxID=152316 RepID=A0A9P8RKP9_9PEZI|nr:mitochondrial carrier protein [Truncatella angustata]KAH6645085.1 mitochondrial carrier protein [Truncatella angustata]